MAVTELVSREVEQRPGEPPKVNVEGIDKMVADKGYHSGAVLEQVKSYEVRTYIPETKQAGQRHWEGKTKEQQAVYQNRRRVPGGYGTSLLRRRANWWNTALRTATRREAWGAHIHPDTTIF
jgi:hypothetical protein